MAVKQGLGSKFMISLSGTWTDVGQVIEFTPFSASVDTVDVTELDDTWANFIAIPLPDGGEVTVKAHSIIAGTSQHFVGATSLWDYFRNGTTGAAGTNTPISCRVFWSGYTGAAGSEVPRTAFSAFVTGIKPDQITIKGVNTLMITLKITDSITHTFS